MKIATLIAGLLFSVVSSASALTWSEIQGNSRYFVDASSVAFKNTNPAALGVVYKRLFSVDGYAQACVAGNMIFGGTTQSCAKYAKTGDDNNTCVAFVANDLYAPTAGTKTVCVNEDSHGNCRQTKTLNYTINTLVSMRIFDKARMTDNYNSDKKGLIGTIKVQLPSCGDDVVPAN